MSQETILPITLRGKLMLETELKKLILEERPAVIKAIEEARAHGDISENAEYDAAKERQAMIEGRIGEIQGKLAGVEAVDPVNIKSDKIVFGATVDIQDTETEESSVYQIVGVDEAVAEAGVAARRTKIGGQCARGQQTVDLRWCDAGVHRAHQGQHAGHVRCRHRRALATLVAWPT